MEREISSTEPAKKPPFWSTIISTAGGAGLIPGAPGTYGTIVAIPLAWALGKINEWVFIAAILVVTAVGSWAADVYCKATKRADNQQIVIDEVAGYLLTLVAVTRSWPNLIIGFVLFRLFDIWKPPPVRWIDRHVHGGFGVVADDLGAGVYGAICLWLIDHFEVVAKVAARLG
jgi:phosphatidylglycerophosphatase A